MKQTLLFKAYVCPMSEELFSDRIMIYKPSVCLEHSYECGQDFTQDTCVSALTDRFRAVLADQAMFGSWAMEQLGFDTVYVQTADVLLGLREDKTLGELFAYFQTDQLELAFIYVPGGASFHCDGYRFEVRPKEEIHRNTPHVHVIRDKESTRYFLETLKRFPQDTFSQTFKKDEKKVILPYLRKNRKKLTAYWNHYINGFDLPWEDTQSRQYYKES